MKVPSCFRGGAINVFDVADQDTIHFASVSIVGNEWQERGITDEETPFYTVDDDRFFITKGYMLDGVVQADVTGNRDGSGRGFIEKDTILEGSLNISFGLIYLLVYPANTR